MARIFTIVVLLVCLMAFIVAQDIESIESNEVETQASAGHRQLWSWWKRLFGIKDKKKKEKKGSEETQEESTESEEATKAPEEDTSIIKISVPNVPPTLPKIEQPKPLRVEEDPVVKTPVQPATPVRTARSSKKRRCRRLTTA